MAFAPVKTELLFINRGDATAPPSLVPSVNKDVLCYIYFLINLTLVYIVIN